MNDLLERLFSLELRQRVLVYVGIAALVGGLYWYFWYSPAAAAIAEKTEAVQSLQTEESKKRRMAANLEKYKAEVKELEAQLNHALAQLPDEKDIPELLSRVSSAGRDSGLDIVLFRQRPENYQDFYAEVPVEMLMRGSYMQVVGFLEAVSQLDRIVNVKDIALKSPVIKGNHVELDTSCTAVTFRFLSEEERKRIAAEKAKKR